jgi:hypothetical protein
MKNEDGVTPEKKHKSSQRVAHRTHRHKKTHDKNGIRIKLSGRFDDSPKKQTHKVRNSHRVSSHGHRNNNEHQRK